MDDSVESQIAADIESLEDIVEEDTGPPPPSTNKDSSSRVLYAHSDHVSCEDLLEFACDRPNTKRTRGPARGADSDEVRIMLKVCGDQVSSQLSHFSYLFAKENFHLKSSNI